MKTINVIRIGTEDGDVQIQKVTNTLEAFKSLVGGFIEVCAPDELRERGIEMLCNEEGLLRQLDPNENLYPFFYVGQCVLVGVDGEDFASLRYDQMLYATAWLEKLRWESGNGVSYE